MGIAALPLLTSGALEGAEDRSGAVAIVGVAVVVVVVVAVVDVDGDTPSACPSASINCVTVVLPAAAGTALPKKWVTTAIRITSNVDGTGTWTASSTTYPIVSVMARPPPSQIATLLCVCLLIMRLSLLVVMLWTYVSIYRDAPRLTHSVIRYSKTFACFYRSRVIHI